MLIDRVLTWANQRHFVSIRALMIYTTLWMTWRAFDWAATYAHVSKFDSIGTAAVIAAVIAPITYLQSAVFKIYMEGKPE
jgi:hypothetical protein